MAVRDRGTKVGLEADERFVRVAPGRFDIAGSTKTSVGRLRFQPQPTRDRGVHDALRQGVDH